METVVISGIGIVSPAGAGPEAHWARLASGRPAWSYDSCGAPVGCVDPEQVDYRRFVERKQQKLVNQRSSFGVAAAGAALEASGLLEAGLAPGAVGVFSAGAISAHGGTADRMRRRLRRLGPDTTPISKHIYQVYSVLRDPIDLLRGMVSSPQDHVAVRNGFRGATCTYLGGPVAGLVALHEAARWVRHARHRAMVVIATDTLVQRFTRRCLRLLDEPAVSLGVAALQADERAPDAVPAEGAASLVIESERQARHRGAPIYARLLGSGVRQLSEREVGTALARAIRAALRAADRRPLVGSVFTAAHSAFQHAAEQRALSSFAGHALCQLSTKGVIGGLGAAAALFDVAVASQALRSGFWEGAEASASGSVLVNAMGDGEAASVLLERP